MIPPLIELISAERRYAQGGQEVTALAGVTLRISHGEFVAIMGQSGSGKSTLMNVLGCLDQLSKGTFLLNGRDVSGLSAEELAALRCEKFGFVFQRYNLLPHLSALENVALPGRYLGTKRKERLARARTLLERVGLGNRLDHRPNELSGGQQQRVSIARALMNGGSVIFADEPTGALDSASGAQMLELLQELHALGHTIIMVTHDCEVASHAQRILELKDGSILRDTIKATRMAKPAVPHVEKIIKPRGLSGSIDRLTEAISSAWSALVSHRLRTGLSLIGVSIGIAAVVSIVSLSDAARKSVDTQLSTLLSGRLLVTKGNPDLAPGVLPRSFSSSDQLSLEGLLGVKRVVVARESSQGVRHAGREIQASVVGADAQLISARKMVLIAGRTIASVDATTREQVAVIDTKSRDLLFDQNDRVLGAQILVGPVPAVVVGIVQLEGSQAFSSSAGQVFLPVSTYAQTIDPRDDVDRLTIELQDGMDPEATRVAVQRRLVDLHGVEDFEVNNLAADFAKVTKVTLLLSAVFSGIAGISLLVGGVGVMNIMLVSVAERTREIGVRMALGARQADVRLQFLIEAIVLCCLGGAAGVTLAWLVAGTITAMSNNFEVVIGTSALILATGVSSVIGLLFGTMPANRAAKLNPVAALAVE